MPQWGHNRNFRMIKVPLCPKLIHCRDISKGKFPKRVRYLTAILKSWQQTDILSQTNQGAKPTVAYILAFSESFYETELVENQSMWNQITLRIRICLLLAALISVTLMGGIITIWYSYRMEILLTKVIDRDIAAFQSAEALEIALVNQKGFLSYYFLDDDPEWLRRLGEARQVFKERMKRANSAAETNEQKETLERIESEYVQYIAVKDRVISYYKMGKQAEGAELHKSVRNRFFRILELCEEYKNLYTAGIRRDEGRQPR